MGQHSTKPSRPNPLARSSASGKRRWTALVAGVAVVAAASTTAWAAVTNGDDTQRATAMKTTAAPSAQTPSSRPSAASQTATPKPPHGGTVQSQGKPAHTPSPSDPEASPKPSSSPSKTPTAPKVAKAERVSKPRTRVVSTGTCGASFYGDPQMTASGERFNPSAMTAAHKTLPLGSRVRVTNPNNGDSVTVRINDRGPYVGGRCLDLSEAAFDAIGNTGSGVMTVKYEVLAR
ncbi:septal ring lytic transglycosylase RlpA family protein [Nonomuraea endophytica]|uniref:septal ring lytic transglycosylase RlpA family protein n=1 Tax=Nonomuraea endophytica TaxID=714136 RepID=UPI0037CC35AF